MANSHPVIVSQASAIEMRPAPIRADWVLLGKPEARSAELSRSRDNDAFTCLWDCTAGTFLWHFGCDETVHILEGEVIITWNGKVCRLKAGDSAYFPAGSETRWQVDHYVRKVAFLREPPPRWIGLGLRIWRKLKSLAPGGRAQQGLVTAGG